ncbi:MAG: hypothetical protein HS116_21220 [Planctomycetes bacterium]|nr:hypothetical protein [Planctomycetota bacterium]
MAEHHDKSHRASASQFFVAAELCRRGFVANVTLGNCPNVDILCTNKAANRFAHIQVKTFTPGSRTCAVGVKAEKDYGESFFWVIAGIPDPNDSSPFAYYVIPSAEMARNIREQHEVWVKTPGKKGRPHDGSTKIRGLVLPPGKNHNGWRVDNYLNRWELITQILNAR